MFLLGWDMGHFQREGILPNMGVSKNKGPQNGWFIMVPNPIKMDDLGFSPLFLETPISNAE